MGGSVEGRTEGRGEEEEMEETGQKEWTLFDWQLGVRGASWSVVMVTSALCVFSLCVCMLSHAPFNQL